MRALSWVEPTLLGDSCIQLWWMPPQPDAGWEESADWSLLNPAEQTRAERFHFSRDRIHFIRRRAFLRRVLADLCGSDPAGLMFEEGPYGKPSLAPASDPSKAKLHFNQSRSAGASLLATSPRHELGVDLELVAPRSKLEGVAGRVQSESERIQWAEIPESERERAFFRLWTRKEALMKVTGEGFQREAASFSVGLEERLGADPVCLEFEGFGPLALVDLALPGTFRGALAVRLA